MRGTFLLDLNQEMNKLICIRGFECVHSNPRNSFKALTFTKLKPRDLRRRHIGGFH